MPVFRRSPSLLASFLVACCLLAFNGPLAAQNASSGDALVLRAADDTAYEREGAPAEPIRPGMKLVQGDRIVTRDNAESTVVLVFSNGSNLTVKPNTSLLLEELSQAEFQPSPATGRYGSLRQEPTTSSTRLRLDEGEILGEVRGLNRESTFEIATDVGTAGIRGTIFRVRIEHLGSVWRMSIANANGGVRAGSAILNLPEQEVGIEEVTVIEAEYDSESGQLSLSNVEAEQLPPEVVAELTREAQEVSEEAESEGAAERQEEPTASEEEEEEEEPDQDEEEFVSPS